ncbi:MAG: hypothetical protein EP338_01610 [Bacteroidetes bacterium]|nr:MAG: hypothetical protein EP338_01610 [Bacteroidota bacterium]
MKQDLIAGLIGVLILTLGLFKLELIKSLAKRISGEKNSLAIALIAIMVVSILPYLISLYFPEDKKDTEVLVTEDVSNGQKTDAEMYMEVAEEAVDLISEVGDKIKENKKIKDSIYEATREKRWVYQIGEKVTDKDLLLDIYKAWIDENPVKVFKTSNNNYLLFLDKGWNEQILNDSLKNFASSVSSLGQKIRVIDLASDCNRKEDIVIANQIKIGKRKNKHFVDCYTCDK